MREDDALAQKLFDTNKHLTTLSAGSTVLIATFMKDIFPELETGALNLTVFAKAVIFVAFVAFFLSTIASVLAMLPYTRYGRRSTTLSVGLFLAGILLFVGVVYFSLNVPEVSRERPNAPEPPVLSNKSVL
jgi:hypothetical protein